MKNFIKKVSGSALACSWLLLTASHSAWAVDISDKPLVMEFDPIPPNVMFMIDDSGSMDTYDQFYTPGYDFFGEDYSCATGANVLPPSSTVVAKIWDESGGATSQRIGYFEVGGTDYVLSESLASFTLPAIAETSCSWMGCSTTTYQSSTTVDTACFDPERKYTVKLKASSCSSRICTAASSASVQYDGGFLNWYFSASSTDYFDYNAGSYDPAGGLSKDLSGPDTNFNEGTGYKQRTSDGDQRMRVAKDVAHILAKGIDNMLVGIASFQYQSVGGEINQELVELDDPATEVSTDDSYDNREDLHSAINQLRAENWTPLAETWTTLMHYFTYGIDSETRDLWTEETPTRANTSTGETGAYTLNGRTCTGGSGCSSTHGVTVGLDGSFSRSLILETMPTTSNLTKDPIDKTVWCRNNFIIGLTDGTPTQDRNLPGKLYTDGYTRAGYFNGDRNYSTSGSNTSDGLDDVAVFMYEQDMRPDIPRSDKKRHNVSTYMIAFGTLSESETRIMESAAVYAGGKFYNAKSGADVAAAMVEILGDLDDATYAEAAVALSSGATALGNNFAFEPSYNTGTWGGSLKAFALDGAGKFQDSAGNAVADTSLANFEWDAGVELTTNHSGANYNSDLSTGGRYIFTQGSSGSPIEFTSTNIGNFVTAVEKDLAAFASTRFPTRTAARLVEYLRGDTSRDGTQNSEGDVAYRDRKTTGDGSILGDIVHSTPVYIQSPVRPWADSLAFGAADYSDFKNDLADRLPMVYVGANDGMLHAFQATDPTDAGNTYTNHGEELFAYIPSFLASANDNEGLHYYAEGDYDHYYYVNATPVATDVYVDFDAARSGGVPNREWHTMLLGGVGKGGKGIYALNITCPIVDSPLVNERNGAALAKADADIATRCASSNDSGFQGTLASNPEDIVLWEFDSTDDSNLGYTYGKPIVGKIAYDRGIAGASDPNGNNNDSKWVAVLGNGYNSTNGYASLFVLMVDGGTDGTWTTGTDYFRIDVDTSGNNGLSVPTMVDVDGDLIYDYAYAGDLKGNVWRFTFDETAASGNYATTVTATKIFQAVDSNGKAQPITTQLQVARDPDTKASDPNLMVVFGTGKALGASDISDNSVQTLYGIHDRGQTSAVGRANLQGRTMTEVTTTAGTARDISGTDVNYSTDYGWYIDLLVGSAQEGERVVFDPILIGSTVFYSISKFTELDCDGPTAGLIASLDWRQGYPATPPFDFNDDGVINNADFTDYNADGLGMLEFDTSQAIVYDPETEQIYGSSGTTEAIDAGYGSISNAVRLSWQEKFPMKL